MIAESTNQGIRSAMIGYLRKTNGSNPSPIASTYTALSQSIFLGASGLSVLCFMDELYESGLGEIGINGAGKENPLLSLCERDAAGGEGTRYLLRYIRWFLERGAIPTFDYVDRIPNVLFTLARCFKGMHEVQTGGRCHTALWIDDIQEVVRLALTRCELTQRDGCNCPCSLEGCLPLYRFLRCEKYYHCPELTCDNWDQRTLDGLLIEWLRICDGTKEEEATYCREAVRLEVFDRLEMTHVCCIHPRLTEIKRPDQQTCADIRDEEDELVLQLDLIMEAYIQFWEKNGDTAEESLRKWWGLVQGILPEPKPHRRCYAYRGGPPHILINQEFGWESPADDDTKIDEKYIGLDFTDAILVHFGKVLGTGWADGFMSER